MASAKVDAGLFDQALVDLRGIVSRNSGNPAAANAYLVMGAIHTRQNRPEDAMAAYIDLRSAYGSSAAAPEATFRLAELLQRSRRPDKDAASVNMLDEVITRFPASPWAGRALAQKAAIDERTKRRVVDPQLATQVPAALVSYRTLVERYPGTPGEEAAYEKLGEMYEDLKRYELAANTFLAMATRFPDSKSDGAWRAAEIFEKRLKNAETARAAYGQVPSRSSHYRDAQKKVQQK
jgi:TolA-binding protein